MNSHLGKWTLQDCSGQYAIGAPKLPSSGIWRGGADFDDGGGAVAEGGGGGDGAAFVLVEREDAGGTRRSLMWAARRLPLRRAASPRVVTVVDWSETECLPGLKVRREVQVGCARPGGIVIWADRVCQTELGWRRAMGGGVWQAGRMTTDMLAEAADPFRFLHRMRVRWGECDMQGIVFNPHYMAFVDVALTEYWRAVGMTYPAAFLAEGVDMFMVAARQVYRDAARFDDEIDVFLRVAYLGTTSLRFAFEIRRDGGVLFEGEATYVSADPVTRRPVGLSERLVAAVMGFERVGPERKKAVLC